MSLKRGANDQSFNETPTKKASTSSWLNIQGIKSEEEVGADRYLINYRRMARSLAGVPKPKHVEPTIVLPSMRNLKDFIHDKPVDGRRASLGKHYRRGCMTMVLCVSSKNLLRQIGVRTAELFNETQWTVPSTAADTMLHTFLRSGFALATETDLVVSPSVQSRRGDNIEYYVNIPFIGRDIGAKGTFHCVACPDIAKGAVIPDLPANIQIYPAKRGGLTPFARKTDTDGQSRWHSVVPHNISNRNRREEHQTAEDSCCYMLWKLSNAISKLEDLRVLCDVWAKSLGLDHKTRFGVYRGKPLLVMNDSRGVGAEIVILVSYAVIEDMGGKVPCRAHIKTSNTARAIPTIGVAIERGYIHCLCRAEVVSVHPIESRAFIYSRQKIREHVYPSAISCLQP